MSTTGSSESLLHDEVKKSPVPTNSISNVIRKNQRSWTWQYFVINHTHTHATCKVVKSNNSTCGAQITLDKSCSTKSLNVHLMKIHHLSDPAKKDKMNASLQTGMLVTKVNILL
jgi:hypothetical protein